MGFAGSAAPTDSDGDVNNSGGAYGTGSAYAGDLFTCPDPGGYSAEETWFGFLPDFSSPGPCCCR